MNSTHLTIPQIVEFCRQSEVYQQSKKPLQRRHFSAEFLEKARHLRQCRACKLKARGLRKGKRLLVFLSRSPALNT